MTNKTIYTCFCTDNIHEGHKRISDEAQNYGTLTVGVLADSQMMRYNRFPVKSTAERVEMVKDLPGVANVIVQNEVSIPRQSRGLYL